MNLTRINYYYRHPGCYDRLGSGDHTTANQVEQLIDTHGPAGARTLLDLGCGTAHHLEFFARRFDCVGVDLQPGMVDYAQRVRPQLDVRVGDLRTIHLGHTVDAITCLGNALSYLHTNTELHQAFATFAAHARPGTVLILVTPVAPSQLGEPVTFRSDSMAADVTVSHDWDLRHQIATMHRRWAFDDGTEAHDHIRRRVLFPRELELHLTLSGFDLIDLADDPTDPDSDLTGTAPYITARYAGCQDRAGSLRNAAMRWSPARLRG